MILQFWIQIRQPICLKRLATSVTTMFKPNLPPSISITWSASPLKDVVYKDTDQLIADSFWRRSPNNPESQHHLKDQEGHVCLRRFHRFLICMSMKLCMVQSASPQMTGKVTRKKDVITVNRVTNLRGGVDSLRIFLSGSSMDTNKTVNRSTSADKVSRNFCNSISWLIKTIVYLVCRQKERRLCQSQFRLTIITVTSITCRNDLPPNYGSIVHQQIPSWNTEFEISGSISKERPRIQSLVALPERTSQLDWLHELLSLEIVALQLWEDAISRPTWNKLIVLFCRSQAQWIFNIMQISW